MKIKRFFRLYTRYIVQYFKTVFEYPVDTVIRVFAMVVTQFSGYVAIWAMFQNITDIAGWSFWEVVLIYATMSMVIGLGELFFEGVWSIAGLAGTGKLDIYLTRPFPVLPQILFSSVGIHGFGNFITALIFFIQAVIHLSVSLSFVQLILFFILIVTALPIHFSLLLLGNSVSLLTRQINSGSFPTLILKLSDFTRYPISIYPRLLQVVFTFFVPYAFVSYYPATFLLGKGDFPWLALLGPVISAVFLFFSIRIFFYGLGKYESAGN